MDTKKRQLKEELEVYKAIDFLSSHPALDHGWFESFLSTQLVFSYPVCKHGHCEDEVFSIYKDHPLAERYKDEFEDEVDGDVSSAYLNYEQYHGYKWEPVEVRWFCEICIFAFNGDTDDDWMRYHGFTVRGYSFNEVIIKMAAKVKKEMGDFCYEDFLTDEEKKNHEEVNFMIPTEIDPKDFKELDIDANGEKLYSMETNPEYIHVPFRVLNTRWLKWFLENGGRELEYYHEDWEGLIKDGC